MDESVSITTLATAKKLSMGPYGKEPMSQFYRWVLYSVFHFRQVDSWPRSLLTTRHLAKLFSSDK